MLRLRFALAILPFVALQCVAPPPKPPERELRVGVLVIDGVHGSDLVGPWDVLQQIRVHVQPGMRVFSVGRTHDAVKSLEGLRLTPEFAFEDAPPIDVLVIPGAEHNLGSDLDDDALIGWVRKTAATADVVMSLADGTFLVGEAGLLEGRSCTTLPADVDALRKRFPRADVQARQVFVVDGHIITGIGGGRSYDPALWLVQVLYGVDVADEVATSLGLEWDLGHVQHVLVVR